MILAAWFSSAGVPATGLSPTIIVRDLSDGSLAVNGSAMTETGSGFYKYSFAGYDPTKDYVIICDGGAGQPVGERYTTASTINAGDTAQIKTKTDGLNFTGNYVQSQVKGFDDIDFSTSQKTSLNAATPASVQNIPATGSGFTALGDTRLANLDAAISTRTKPADTQARVTLVDTTTVNSDMRGTDSAALASVCTETRLAELDAGNLPTDIAALPTDADVNAACDSAIADAAIPAALATAHGAGSWLTATGFSTHSAADVWAVSVRTLSTFGSLVADIATAVWGASVRTLSAFGFALGFATPTDVTGSQAAVESAISGLKDFDPAVDVVARVTLVDTVTANSDMRGTDSAALASVCTEGRLAHLDADISSRTKPADTQAAVTTVTNLTNAPTVGDFTSTMKGSITSAVPSVLDIQSGMAIPTTLQIRTDLDANSSKLAHLDANVSSRSSHSVADIWQYSTRTLTAIGAASADIAAAVWGYVARTITSFGFNLGFATPANVTTAQNHIESVIGGEIAALNDFDPLHDTVARVTLADSVGNIENITVPESFATDIAEAVWNGTDRSLTEFGFVTGLATSAELEAAKTHIESAADATLQSLLNGTGAIAWTYVLTQAGDGLPIADAEIWITTDSSGLNIIASGRTDNYGEVDFMVDAGTLYVWRKKAGYNFINPDIEVVS